MSVPQTVVDVVKLRSFVPASNLQVSVQFYAALGFTVTTLGPGIAEAVVGPFTFLIQQFEAPGFAGNYMMQIVVNDLDACWKKIESLDLAATYGVRAPKAPAMQPWGLIVAYVVDPSGVLWHFAQAK